MIVSLFTKEKLYTVSLPQKISGKYWISDRDPVGHSRNVANIEGIQGKWMLHGSSALALIDSGDKEVQAVALEQGIQVINAQYRKGKVKVQFYIEPTTKERQSFKKYVVSKTRRINIGRTDDNQIVYGNRFVSAHHACLVWENDQWTITDTQSSNGVFVNENRITTKQLDPGDVICILGLKIIVGHGFLALNNPDELVRVSSGTAAPLKPQNVQLRGGHDIGPIETITFTPSPAMHKKIEHAEVRVDAPPNAQKVEETPLALLLGPALTMGMTAIVMALVALANYNNGTATLASVLPTLVMSFSMLCGTLLWPPLTRCHEKKKRLLLEELRQQKYEEYLTQVRGNLFRIGEEQRTILLDSYPSFGQCVQAASTQSSLLWERGQNTDSFLTLRMGLGQIPVAASIRFPEQRFSLEDDALQNMVYRLAQEHPMIDKAPVICSLDSHGVIGIAGPHDEAESYLANLVLQLATLHSYEDIKIVFLMGDSISEDWQKFRLLPHTWDNESQIRYWAGSENDGKSLSSALEKIISERVERQGGVDSTTKVPHYVLVAPNLEYARQINIFKQVLSSDGRFGASCIVVAPEVASLPRECSMVVQLNGQDISLFDMKNPTDPQVSAQRDDTEDLDMGSAIEVLANLNIARRSDASTLPNMITFLELYRSGKVEHLNAPTRWKENNPVISLQTPIGVNADGSVFYLDLHEKHHGPHGLVAGMTGSGKSEFIITFILSMAVNYHPDEVSFILIDYKGGGLAGAFEDTSLGIKLPHLAGTITNLDGSAASRALISIQSELRRRQTIFNEARKVSGGGTIDIYKYQTMYRDGLLDEPIPHLFIISDEFAELKAQQPEFMSQLISTARIGRSLGVHLILATQKPSGVVDEQIWSNSRFRVCLKVQEKADSMEMLKRPDAAELNETGRFYLQVGFNELFELGQSAWCGAPYLPADQVQPKTDDSVEVIDNLGQVIATAKQKAVTSTGDGRSQIVSVVSYLSDLADDEKVSTRQLWLPPIPEHIYLEDLKKQYGWEKDKFMLNPVLGEYDDPGAQAKTLLTLPFTAEGNALLYGITGSGKSGFIETLLCGLIQDYTAEELNVYIVDLGEETLRAFDQAPQVGDVLLSSDGEKIQNLFKMLEEELSRRKKKFAQADGDYISYRKGTGEIVPHVLVVLRNYSAFYEQFELLDTTLTQLTRECSKYGIYFLVTANSASSLRYRVAQNFPNVYCLQLNDQADYLSLFGRTEGVYPSKLKGRGIFKADKVYEFQTAHFAQEYNLHAIRALAARLNGNAGHRAPNIPHLPERVTTMVFPDEISLSAFPVGIQKETLKNAYIDLTYTPITLLAGRETEEMVETAQGLTEQLTHLPGTVTVWDGSQQFIEPKDFAYGYLRSGFQASIERLFKEMVHRNNSYKTATQKGESTPEFDPEYYVITGLKTILSTLDTDHKDKLNTLLGHAQSAYAIHFLLCDSDQILREFVSEDWYKNHVSGTDGIWAGDGIAEQYIFRIGSLSSNLYSALPPHFGYIVRKGRPILTKLMVRKTQEGEA